ncbi:hypothetical protein TeGR_g4777 [Tetraparma gracilis]|uniref:Steroid 5-alpha reductase C-terminal domain-containing protein n=1 Tax=Tetraparma gracilis TaxID=2962635 RepID=A0ABQ6MSW0_9STRA|nr:hypothetical protein TeGR_g4777 [Tetraparma gracilis]
MELFDDCSLSSLSASSLLDPLSAPPPLIPLLLSFDLMLIVATLCLVISVAASNYSQVDKIWSITPFLFAWIPTLLPLFHPVTIPGLPTPLTVPLARNLLMSLLSTIWGCRLTWNFNRRGGYHFPKFWEGEEDYRWPLLRGGKVPALAFLSEPVPWTLFNIFFIAYYQNLLLWLTAAPAMVVFMAGVSCEPTAQAVTLTYCDYVLATAFLGLVFVEATADNAQYAFQTEKYRLINAKKPRTGELADGFLQSGLYAIVRKPNYAAEQSIWIVFYLFSALATSAYLNWSAVGFLLLVSLFQGSGWMTELITKEKYAKYRDVYCKRVGLYEPFTALYWMYVGEGGEEKKEETLARGRSPTKSRKTASRSKTPAKGRSKSRAASAKKKK